VRFIFEPRRLIVLSWLIFLSVVTAPARTVQLEQPSAPAPIEVIKLKWEKEARLPRNFDPSPIPTNGAFNPPASSNASIGIDQKNRTSSTELDPYRGTSLIPFPAIPPRLPLIYLYSMKIRNRDTKTIEGIAWDYVFTDPKTNSELGRHQFLSYERVSPDQLVTLQRRVHSRPIRVVPASSSSRNQPLRFVERADIQCVLYGDDTVWRSQQTREGVCELLKNGQALSKTKRSAAR